MNQFDRLIESDKAIISMMMFMEKNYDNLDDIVLMYVKRIQDSICLKEQSLFHIDELSKYLKSDKCLITDSIKKKLILLCDRFKYGNNYTDLSDEAEKRKKAEDNIITYKEYCFYKYPNVFLKLREE